MSRRNKNLGDWGERQGCGFLTRHGFKIIARNYRMSRGEVDIIAIKGGDFYFIEVKTRLAGDLAESSAITWQKKRRLTKAAMTYCLQHLIGESAIVLAGLLVVVDRLNRKLNFIFFVLY